MQIRTPTASESAPIGRELLLPFYREEESVDPDFNRLDVDDDQNADHWLDHPERGIFVATVDAEIVGVVTFGRSSSPPIYERGDVAHLEGLYVKTGVPTAGHRDCTTGASRNLGREPRV